VLGLGISLRSGTAIPAHGLVVVLREYVARGIPHTQVVLGLCETLLSGAANLAHGQCAILRDPSSLGIHHAQDELRAGGAPVSS